MTYDPFYAEKVPEEAMVASSGTIATQLCVITVRDADHRDAIIKGCQFCFSWIPKRSS